MRQNSFLTTKQMERVRDVALLGMITPVTIERRTAADPPAGGDYGDDFLSYATTNASRRQMVKG